MPEMSVFPGVTRRDFFKSCGGLAALVGMPVADAAQPLDILRLVRTFDP